MWTMQRTPLPVRMPVQRQAQSRARRPQRSPTAWCVAIAQFMLDITVHRANSGAGPCARQHPTQTDTCKLESAAAVPQKDAELGEQATTPAGSSARRDSGGIGKTPWRTPPPVFAEAATPATAIAASGWQELCGAAEQGAQLMPAHAPASDDKTPP